MLVIKRLFIVIIVAFTALLIIGLIGDASSSTNNHGLDGEWVGQWRYGGSDNQDILIFAGNEFIWLSIFSDGIGTFSVSDNEIEFVFTDGPDGEAIRVNVFSFSHTEDSITLDGARRFLRKRE